MLTIIGCLGGQADSFSVQRKLEASRLSKLHTFDPKALNLLAHLVEKLNLSWPQSEAWLGGDSFDDSPFGGNPPTAFQYLVLYPCL